MAWVAEDVAAGSAVGSAEDMVEEQAEGQVVLEAADFEPEKNENLRTAWK